MAFNPDAPQYRTCCCHVKTCTIIIAIWEAIGVVAMLVDGLVAKFSNNTADGTYRLIGGAVGFAIYAIIIVLLIIGLVKEHPGFLIPHLVMQVLSLILMALAALMYVLELCGVLKPAQHDYDPYKLQSNKNENNGTIEMIVRIVAFVLGALISIWFFLVVLKCYRYFRDKRRAGYMPGAPVSVAYHA